MRCGQVRCCGELIAWAAPGTWVVCPRCGKNVTAKSVARLPGHDTPAQKKVGRRGYER